MTFCSIHRSMNIREHSSLQQMGANTDPQPVDMQRVSDFGILSPKWDVTVKSLTSVIRRALRKQSLLNTTGLVFIGLH